MFVNDTYLIECLYSVAGLHGLLLHSVYDDSVSRDDGLFYGMLLSLCIVFIATFQTLYFWYTSYNLFYTRMLLVVRDVTHNLSMIILFCDTVTSLLHVFTCCTLSRYAVSILWMKNNKINMVGHLNLHEFLLNFPSCSFTLTLA